MSAASHEREIARPAEASRAIDDRLLRSDALDYMAAETYGIRAM